MYDTCRAVGLGLVEAQEARTHTAIGPHEVEAMGLDSVAHIRLRVTELGRAALVAYDSRPRPGKKGTP